tara:strand:- start:309 stop:875 length:567 start_codon:yes stop_codon:yes gene_type:complete
MLTQLPIDVYKDLKQQVTSRRDDNCWDMNDRLVGAMKQQSSLMPVLGLEDYLLMEAGNLWYSEEAQGNPCLNTCPWNGSVYDKRYLTLRDLWVNYQRKGEYNPLHSHHGVISFVIFVDVPYGADERRNHGSDGCFQLENTLLPVDFKWNGRMLMFPANTRHAVYPFHSTDKERITVAGNLHWNVHDLL